MNWKLMLGIGSILAYGSIMFVWGYEAMPLIPKVMATILVVAGATLVAISGLEDSDGRDSE